MPCVSHVTAGRACDMLPWESKAEQSEGKQSKATLRRGKKCHMLPQGGSGDDDANDDNDDANDDGGDDDDDGDDDANTNLFIFLDNANV